VTTNEPGTPLSPFEQGALLYDRWLLDLPKVLDICVLFGAENRAAVAALIDDMMRLQPKYGQDLVAG